MARLKIKKGDTVEVIAGKDASKRGRVLRVDGASGRAESWNARPRSTSRI